MRAFGLQRAPTRWAARRRRRRDFAAMRRAPRAARPVEVRRPLTSPACPPRPTQARNASASYQRGICDQCCVRGMLETPLYIACLRLSGRDCLVVGGGEVGLEKVEGLLACDGRVTLVAPEASRRAARARRRGLDRLGAARVRRRRPRGQVPRDRGHRRHRRQHRRLRGGRAPGDARQRRRRAARSATSSSRRSSAPARWRSRSRPPAPRRRSRSGSSARSPTASASPTRGSR